MIRLIEGNTESVITEQEANAILKAWSVEKHLSEINQQHDDIFNKILSDYNYASEAELSLWTQEPLSEYFDEANAIKEWYRNSWFEIKEYGDTVTEATQKTIEQIITPFEF